MIKKLTTLTCLFSSCFFNSGIIAQEAEIFGKQEIMLFDNPMNALKRKGLKDIENYSDENGGIFTTNGVSVRYAPNKGREGAILTKKISELGVKHLFFNDNNSPQPIQVKLIENQFVADYVQSDDQKKTYVVRLTFDKELNLINQEKLADFVLQPGSDFFAISENKELMAFFSVKIIDENKEQVSFNIDYTIVSGEEGTTSQNSIKHGPVIKKINNVFYFAETLKNQIASSFILFDDKQVNFTCGGIVNLLNTEDNKVSKLDYLVEKQIKFSEYFFSEDNRTYIIGSYKTEKDFGLAVLKLSNDKSTIEEQNYYPIPGMTKTELLWYSKKYFKRGEIVSCGLYDVNIDNTGAVTAVLYGRKQDVEGLPTYPVNIAIIKCKDGKILNQKIIPYANKEAQYFSTQSEDHYVSIEENKVTVIFNDYIGNYGPDNKFINPEKMPKARISQAIYTYDLKSGKSQHTLVYLNMPDGVEYNSLFHKPSLYKINGCSYYVIRVDDWGAAKLQNSYFGILEM